MEGSRRKCVRRRIVRLHETSRLEDELWALVYDRIWPSVPRMGKQSRVAPPSKPGVSEPDSFPIAKECLKSWIRH
jgi:hypothetical protein